MPLLLSHCASSADPWPANGCRPLPLLPAAAAATADAISLVLPPLLLLSKCWSMHLGCRSGRAWRFLG